MLAIESGLYEALKSILQELKDEHPDTGYWVRIDHPDLGNNIFSLGCAQILSQVFSDKAVLGSLWTFKDDDLDNVVQYYISSIENIIESGHILNFHHPLKIIIHRLCPSHIENLPSKKDNSTTISNKGYFNNKDEKLQSEEMSLIDLLETFSLKISSSQPKTPSDGNCAIHVINDQIRY